MYRRILLSASVVLFLFGILLFMLKYFGPNGFSNIGGAYALYYIFGGLILSLFFFLASQVTKNKESIGISFIKILIGSLIGLLLILFILIGIITLR